MLLRKATTDLILLHTSYILKIYIQHIYFQQKKFSRYSNAEAIEVGWHLMRYHFRIGEEPNAKLNISTLPNILNVLHISATHPN